MQPVTVYLIDSNRLFRDGLKRLLQGSLTIVGEAGSLSAARSALAASGEHPALVLLDPDGAGDGEIRALVEQLPHTRVVALSATLCPQRLAHVLREGGHGYLVKDVASDALRQSLELVLLGEKVFPTNLVQALLAGWHGDSRGQGADLGAHKGLSPRETQILRRLITGESNKVIANHLRITEATVKVHLKGLLRKIHVTNRTQAAIWGMNNGIGSDAPAVFAA